MKKDAPAKSKFKTLKRRLGKPHYAVVGVLESLWMATQIDAIDGAIGKLSNEEIAAALEWDGDADALIKSLVDTGWLDADPEYRLIVHDWSEHVPTFVKGAFEKHKKPFADQVAKQRAKHGAKHGLERPAKDGALQVASDGALARPILSHSIQTDSSQSNPSQIKAAADAAFDLFWSAFPAGRKTKKGKAREAFARAIKKITAETLIAAAAEYAASPKGKSKWVQGPEPWLNGECWNDDRTAWQRGDEYGNGKPSRVGPGQQYDPSDNGERSL